MIAWVKGSVYVCNIGNFNIWTVFSMRYYYHVYCHVKYDDQAIDDSEQKGRKERFHPDYEWAINCDKGNCI